MRSKLVFGLVLCAALAAFGEFTPQASAAGRRYPVYGNSAYASGTYMSPMGFYLPATAYRVRPVYPNPYVQAYYRNLYLQQVYYNRLRTQWLLSGAGGGGGASVPADDGGSGGD
jgi:hypothetical protein